MVGQDILYMARQTGQKARIFAILKLQWSLSLSLRRMSRDLFTTSLIMHSHENIG